MTYKITLSTLLREFKKKYIRIVLAFIAVLIIGLPVAFAQFPTGWQHKQKVLIQNPGTAKDDYPVSLNINTQALVLAGKMRSDGNDIRFAKKCDGAEELEY